MGQERTGQEFPILSIYNIISTLRRTLLRQGLERCTRSTTMLKAIVLLLTLACLQAWADPLHDHLFLHPLATELNAEIRECAADADYCDRNFANITALSAKLANDYSFLLLHDVVQSMFIDAFFTVSPDSRLGKKISHMRASLAYSVGDFVEARRQWQYMNDSDPVALRSWAAQEIVSGSEQSGLHSMQRYIDMMSSRLGSIVLDNIDPDIYMVNSSDRANTTAPPTSSSSQASERESDELIVSILLGEAFGGIRVNPKLGDVTLTSSSFGSLEASVHFRLGVGLAKLGMYDLSVKHVSLSATPWEAPLYRLRSQLAFPPTHASLRSLAQAVDTFESQCESILLFKTHKKLLMTAVCNSLDEAALALQALPLLHLAGYSAPREGLMLGHSPVGLQRLLGEVYTAMCPVTAIRQVLPLPPPQDPRHTLVDTAPGLNGFGSSSKSHSQILLDERKDNAKVLERHSEAGGSSLPRLPKKKEKVKLGVVSGSFDGIAGRLIVGMLL